MKYKNIHSAIHNFGHSFTSLMNYFDSDYVLDELVAIHQKGIDIEVDWKSGIFNPENQATTRIKKSITYYTEWLPKHLESHNVEIEKLETIKFVWPARQRKYMIATDDCGKEYKIYVNEMK